MEPVVTDSPRSEFNPAMRRKARHYALQALYQWQISRNPLHQIETQFRAEYDFSGADVAFFHALLHEIPAQVGDLEQAFGASIDRAIKELDPIELTLLRMGTYELTNRVDIPFKVVINEYVALAKKFGATDGHKYINGVLDKLAARLRRVEVDASRQRR